MHAEDLLTDSPTPEAVLVEVARLPRPHPEQEQALRLRLEATASLSPLERGWPPLLQAPYAKRDSRFANPPTSHRPVLGPVVVLAKRAFRLTFQPLINEVMRRQVEFNEELLNSLATLYEYHQIQARTQSLWREELDARLARLEQTLARVANGQAAPSQPSRSSDER